MTENGNQPARKWQPFSAKLFCQNPGHPGQNKLENTVGYLSTV
jgi:hypothetical protein